VKMREKQGNIRGVAHGVVKVLGDAVSNTSTIVDASPVIQASHIVEMSVVVNLCRVEDMSAIENICPTGDMGSVKDCSPVEDTSTIVEVSNVETTCLDNRAARLDLVNAHLLAFSHAWPTR
jgi:hypothetical protein